MDTSPLSSCLPEEAYAIALASIRSIGPKRRHELLSRADPLEVWERVISGKLDREDTRCERDARSVDVGSLWRSYVEAGVSACYVGSASYPMSLAALQRAPGVLFYSGDISVLNEFPKVAIVGTRSATRYGLGVASEFAAELAALGVCVLSGLAQGIDTAAHEGSCGGWDRSAGGGAPPGAVAAGGLGGQSSSSEERTRRRISKSGVVVSGEPIGVPPARWSFSARSKLMAMLVDAVVVVESHLKGGSFHTVDVAAQLGKPVGAVPGSIRSPASAGTNSLLADGCFPVRDTSDILTALSLSGIKVPANSLRERAQSHDVGDEDLFEDLLAALGWERCSLEELVNQMDQPVGAVCSLLEQLACKGRVRGGDGFWERLR